MNTSVLVALTGQEMRSMVAGLLRGALSSHGTEPAVDEARDAAQARDRLAAVGYRLAVVDAHLPAPASGTVDRSQRTALTLLKEIREQSPGTAVVVLTTVATEELFQCVQDLGRCRLVVQSGPEWSDRLVRYSEKLLAGAANDLPGVAPPLPAQAIRGAHASSTSNGINAAPTRVTLEIRLNLEQRTWSYAFQGKGTVPFDYTDTLDLSRHELMGLVARSKALAALFELLTSLERTAAAEAVERIKHQWSSDLQGIGRDLWKEIFDKNPRLLYRLGQAVERAGGFENCRLRFLVEREIHPLVLEAVPSMESPFWILEGPVVRSINMLGSEFPLFFDPETREHPVDMLIIEANVQGTVRVGDRDVKLPELKNIGLEADRLAGLKNGTLQERLGRIRRVPGRPEDLDHFEDAVESALRDGPWHVVHYAGHSYYDSASQTGYIFFPGPGGLGISPVRSSVFRHWLKTARVRFVYLSSCQSSADDFVFELAKAGVPAILGFRWVLDDALAASHAKTFYDALFARRSLEHAFLETRRSLHARDEKDPVWAAPTLILQVG